MEVNEGSGWELSKENIQPLSSGRKMSFLTHSLDRTDEAELSRNQRDWESYVSEYDGPDPLEAWLKYIEFMEQSCPTGGRTNAKYETVLTSCFQQCYQLPQYTNDKRFIEVYLKAIQNYAPAKRADLIQGVLNKGFGVSVSRMYLALADALEATHHFQEASKVLKKGIDSGAQPVEYLQDELNNLQYRVAERLAKSMQQAEDGEEPLRNFGMSVPVCKLTNEAQNFRVALSPSNPCRARPIQQKSEPVKVPIFQGFSETEQEAENRAPQTEMLLQPSKESELMRNEQENVIKPKKWCNELMPPPPTAFVPSNLPPVEIYVEEPPIQPKTDDRKVAKGVLSERKVVDEEMKPALGSGQEKVYRKNEIYQGRHREISFEHLRAKEYMKKVGVSTLRALVALEKPSAPRLHERLRPHSSPLKSLKQAESIPSTGQAPAAAAVNPAFRDNANELRLSKENAELKRNLEQVLREKSELSDALTKRDETLRELEETVAKYQNALEEETRRTGALRSQLSNHIRMQEENKARFEQEIAEYSRELNQERLMVEKLLQEKELMKQQFEEEKARMQQEFERERNESLLSFRNRSVHHDEEKLISFTSEAMKENMSPPRVKQPGVPVVPMPAMADKLGFTLYESNMEMGVDNPKFEDSYKISMTGGDPAPSTGAFRSNMSYISSLNMNDDFAMPPPPPKDQPKFPEEDKENMAFDSNRLLKQGRALSGILQPSKTAEPMELICTEEEDEDEVIQNDNIADFNVTDLTRALQLCPRPLVNSTPEKSSKDLTCGLSPSQFQPRRPFGSIDVPRFELPGPSGENDLRGEMEPIVYEDEPQTMAGKSHGLSMHPNLSPIPETSKERWSSCTSSSSSTNMTHTRATGNFSHGSSYSATKFVPRTGGRFIAPQRRPGDATY